MFETFPGLGVIKEKLYEGGAVFALMSGSGSTIYGIFKDNPLDIKDIFNTHKVFVIRL